MKSRIPAFIIGILLLAVSASADVTHTVLPNGMKVIVREGHSINLVAVDIWVRAGSVNETPESNGVSHFVEHMIFKATKKYGPGEADREIEGLGAELNGGTAKDYVHFYATVASEYLPNALEVLADAITNAQFRPDDVEKERLIIADEIARADGNPTQRAFALFSQTAFGAHPYALPPAGTRDCIGKLSRDAMFAYYRKHYTPANTVVSIAGDVTPADAVAAVQKAFAGFSAAASSETAPAVQPAITAPREKQFDSHTDKAYIVFGYNVPGVSQFKDTCTLDVILALLGDKYQGRVYSALTAKGISFGDIETDFLSQRYSSTISTLVACEPKDADAVADVLRSEYRRLAAEQVSDGELEHARRLVEGADLFDQETFSGQARVLGLYETIATHDLALKYGPTVRTVTAAGVAGIASGYFGEDNYCLVKIIPKGQGN